MITVANSAYLAHVDHGYVPMLRPAVLTRPVLVVAAHASLASIPSLRGAVIALPDPLAVISMQGMHMLREAELDPERDVIVNHHQNHAAAVNHVISGEAAAVPGVMYLASPKVSPARVARLNQAILEFVRNTEAGRDLMKNPGYDGLIPATSEDLKPLAPYGAQLKAALTAKP